MIASPDALSSRRLRFWLPWMSALVLVAGLVTFLIVYDVGGIRNTSKPVPAPLTNKPAQQVQPLGKTVPLSKEVRDVAARWIIASVARTDLAKSWEMTAPDLRRGFTRKEWLTGSNPIIPYPLGNSVGGIVRINWSTKDGRTSVHGGYGIYFDRVTLEIQSLERGLDGRALPIEVRD